MSKDSRFVLLVSGSPRGASAELLWELASGMSFVVAVDSGAEWCRAAGVIPDLLIGDLDSCTAESRAAFATQDVEVLVFPVDKNASDLELAIDELVTRGFSDLVATNVTGGRTDHELAALGNLVAAGERGLAVTAVEPQETLIFMNAPGVRQELKLNFGEGISLENAPTVSLIPWGAAAEVSASGFKWPLEKATLLPTASRGVSNIPVSAEPRIYLHQGALIVVVQTPALP
ncbi:MAG: thiamine diphosphokinase [Actinomycetia bacterium]|nr:thiamine diphosphokinase [Actinomycetes bacterium]